MIIIVPHGNNELMLLLFLLLLMMIDWVWEHWGSFVRNTKLPHYLVSTLMLVEILQIWRNIPLKLKLKIKAGLSSFPTITGYTIIVLPVLPSAENRSIISLLTPLLFYNHWKGHCTAHSPRREPDDSSPSNSSPTNSSYTNSSPCTFVHIQIRPHLQYSSHKRNCLPS